MIKAHIVYPDKKLIATYALMAFMEDNPFCPLFRFDTVKEDK